mgnify:FL=1
MKTLFLAIIATCYIANTVAIYEADNGGTNVFFGNFGYHIEGATQ